ncbi:MAG: hypothetical protein HZA17_06975 [Nitrospirae bacterium]|nr:hypothetical protein [Nitrospirota bacterium]
MTKKLLQMLQMITRNIKDMEFYSEEILDTISYDEPDLFDISEELSIVETSESLGEEELDILKSLLVYILMRRSSFEKEDIYSLIFGGGRRIIWN